MASYSVGSRPSYEGNGNRSKRRADTGVRCRRYRLKHCKVGDFLGLKYRTDTCNSRRWCTPLRATGLPGHHWTACLLMHRPQLELEAEFTEKQAGT